MENIDCVDSLDPTYGYHKETTPPHVLCGLPGQTPKRIAKKYLLTEFHLYLDTLWMSKNC